jgi:ATP-binding cassette subfamily C (CFTR/MRP) protein 4
VSVERILQYTKNIAESDVASRDVPKLWPQEGNIEFRSVSLCYDSDDPPVLNKISFNVKATEKIGVIERTGAGKSSLISVLFRLYPFDGQVVIDGVDTKEISLTSLRSVISVVPQNCVLFSGILRKNLDPLNEYSDVDIWNALEQVEH